MDNLIEFFFGLYLFAIGLGVAGIAAGVWEYKKKKKVEQQAQKERRTKIRHAEDMDKLQQTKQMKLLYYDTLLYKRGK